MSKFALNYSPQAAALLMSGAIQIDLFKCADWDGMVSDASKLSPVYVHFPLNLGRDEIGDMDRAELFAERTGTEMINSHLVPYPGVDAYDRACGDLRTLQQRFAGRVVMFENVPYPLTDPLIPREAVSPEFICKLADQTGSGFLLDLAHARIAAIALQIDPFEYISALPVASLRELHVTGVIKLADGGYEDHNPMSDPDWEIFHWAMRQIASRRWPMPKIISCEYGGIGERFIRRSERSVIERDIPRMYQEVRNANAALSRNSDLLTGS